MNRLNTLISNMLNSIPLPCGGGAGGGASVASAPFLSLHRSPLLPNAARSI